MNSWQWYDWATLGVAAFDLAMIFAALGMMYGFKKPDRGFSFFKIDDNLLKVGGVGSEV